MTYVFGLQMNMVFLHPTLYYKVYCTVDLLKDS